MNSKLMLFVGAAIIVVLGLFYGMRSPSLDSSPKPAALAQPGAVVNTSPATNNVPVDNTPSPWANSGNSSTISGAKESAMNANDARNVGTVDGKNDVRNGLTVPGKKLTAIELQKFQDELLATMQSGNPDSKRLKEILTRLKQTQGNTIGGVNVDVLLNNLEKSQQIQDVAAQLQKESQKPGGPDQRKMQDHMDNLKKLQAQMRTDVMVANPAMQTQAK
ncbi:hypothetical protein [Undibacterium sp. Ji22W]|uniref:hypothetical protein n=1 Tax=Undibacterium sp. Ji22W TaxID=3413038 RepID=UPI003BF30665